MIVHPSPPSGSALRQRMIEDMTVRGFTEKRSTTTSGT